MENLVNDHATTLNGGIDASVTSLVVVTNTTPANRASFRIRIDNELMLVTANASTTWTVTRGVESTTAAVHANGAFVSVVVTEAGFTAWFADVLALNGDLKKISSGTSTIYADTCRYVVNQFEVVSGAHLIINETGSLEVG